MVVRDEWFHGGDSFKINDALDAFYRSSQARSEAKERREKLPRNIY